MIDITALHALFEATYGRSPRVYSAPGRVNLIGEHTDYNDGYVLPMAIEARTRVAVAPRTDARVMVHSLTRAQNAGFDLENPGPPRRGLWLDYVEGTARALIARGLPVRGADMIIDSDVPAGAGLSASAALEMSVGHALLQASDLPTDLLTLALAGQAAEHTYVGTQCGIMDQYVSAFGRQDHALLLDCRSLSAVHVPLALHNACVLICDTGVKHELCSSHYNQRRLECEEGVRLLKTVRPSIVGLRDVSTSEFASIASSLPVTVRRRCAHVVSENERTLSAADALRAGQLRELGSLMKESHASLRDDYEVSCPELDEAVAAAQAQPGVYGSRMTGGGFGGCTVTVLESSVVLPVQRAITGALNARFGRTPRMFTTRACAGVGAE